MGITSVKINVKHNSSYHQQQHSLVLLLLQFRLFVFHISYIIRERYIAWKIEIEYFFICCFSFFFNSMVRQFTTAACTTMDIHSLCGRRITNKYKRKIELWRLCFSFQNCGCVTSQCSPHLLQWTVCISSTYSNILLQNMSCALFSSLLERLSQYNDLNWIQWWRLFKRDQDKFVVNCLLKKMGKLNFIDWKMW